MTRWTYEGKEVKSHDDLDPLCTDIVYCIYYTNGQMYFGKKTVRSKSTLPARKRKPRENAVQITKHVLRNEYGMILTTVKARKEARARGLKAKAEPYEEVITNKPFLDYVGSSKETEGLEIAAKEIIYQCSTKQTATYLEAMLLFDVNALIDPIYVNSNILGSFFDNALEGLIETKEK